MTYKESVNFLFSLLPMYQRIGAAAYKPGLANTLKLANKFGNPHNNLQFIHIAGTNGKGSVSHILASLFMELGWKTGLYTSPHLKDFRERIKINGKCISKEYVKSFVNNHKIVIKELSPSFFELTFIMALKYFEDKKADIVILETGMGGRLDSTNIVVPQLSVITNISKDHIQFLGNTLKKIAHEKAGIIKPGIPVVLGEKSSNEAFLEIKKTAELKEAPFLLAENIKIRKQYDCELKGQYQTKNIKTVLASIQMLEKIGYSFNEKIIRKGIQKVVSNTGLKGRFQILQIKPKIIADIGHNEAGIAVVLKALKNEKYHKLHIVIGVVNDKDIRSILKILPKNANYYFTNAKIPRALNANKLKEIASEFNLKGESFTTVTKALSCAKENANKSDLILVTGSAFVVAEVV